MLLLNCGVCSKNKVRHILFTKKAETAEEVKTMRETWRKTLYKYAREVVAFSVKSFGESGTDAVERRLKTLFANFELYGYNHLEDEKDYVKIDMFCEYV